MRYFIFVLVISVSINFMQCQPNIYISKLPGIQKNLKFISLNYTTRVNPEGHNEFNISIKGRIIKRKGPNNVGAVSFILFSEETETGAEDIYVDIWFNESKDPIEDLDIKYLKSNKFIVKVPYSLKIDERKNYFIRCGELIKKIN